MGKNEKADIQTGKTNGKIVLRKLKKAVGISLSFIPAFACFFYAYFLAHEEKWQTVPPKTPAIVGEQEKIQALSPTQSGETDKILRTDENMTAALGKKDADIAGINESQKEENGAGKSAQTETSVADSFITPQTTEELAKIFGAVRLEEDSSLTGYPRIYITAFPEDFKEKGSKELFIKALLPLILRNNEIILKRRIKLQPLLSKAEKGSPLTEEEQSILNEVFAEYDLIGDTQQMAKDLSQMMLPVSPALALAQAAYASDFGKKERIRVFDQYAWTMPPESKWEQIPYQNLFDAVEGYALDLNRQPTYFKWRQYRVGLFFAKPGNFLNGFLFAKRMGPYMPEKPSYVWHLLNLFKWHQLHRYDTAFLEPETSDANAGKAEKR